jgi:hypothetical protein
MGSGVGHRVGCEDKLRSKVYRTICEQEPKSTNLENFRTWGSTHDVNRLLDKAYLCDQLCDHLHRPHLQPESENLTMPNSHGVEDSKPGYWVSGDT